MFGLGQLRQTSQMFVDKAVANLCQAPFWWPFSQALDQAGKNARQGQLQLINKNSLITDKKKFYNISPR